MLPRVLRQLPEGFHPERRIVTDEVQATVRVIKPTFIETAENSSESGELTRLPKFAVVRLATQVTVDNLVAAIVELSAQQLVLLLRVVRKAVVRRGPSAIAGTDLRHELWSSRVESRFRLRGLWPVLILVPFHLLFLFRCLLFLALVLIFLATFVSHCVILSIFQSSFE